MRGTLGEYLTDKAARALIAAAMALPYERRIAFVGASLRRAVGPLAGWRRRAEGQIGWIWPDMPAQERAAIAAGALDNAGRTLIENYSWREFGLRLAATEPEGPGLAALEAARAEGRPVLFVTGHFGNHEAPRQMLTRLGHSIGGLYRPMNNPWFNDHYAATMAGMSGPVFAKRTETRGFVKHLSKGGWATILIDTYENRGTALDFLGKPAPSSLSAALLARRYGALMVPYFGVRQADGLGFRVIIEAPVAEDAPEPMMQAATDRLAAQVRAHPEQWFWLHRRWKPERLKAQARARAEAGDQGRNSAAP